MFRIFFNTLFLLSILVASPLFSASQAQANIDAYNDALRSADAKVKEFVKAVESGDPIQIQQKNLEIQQDPAAIKQLNKQPFSIRKKYVQTTKSIQAKTKNLIRQKVAEELGIPKYKVKIKKFTNKTSKVKAGHDWDITVEVDGKDMPLDDVVQRTPKGKKTTKVIQKGSKTIVEESYYEATTGQKSPPASNKKALEDYHAKASNYAKKHNVEITNATSGEAYEGGKAFIDNTDTHQVKDSGRLSKTIEHKSDLEAQKVKEYTESEELGKAQVARHEQARQYTKQYKNIVEPRIKAMGGKIPPKVAEGTKILDMIGKKVPGTNTIFTPEDADIALAKMGETTESIIKKGSALVETAQKLRPPKPKTYVKVKKGIDKFGNPIIVSITILSSAEDLKQAYKKGGAKALAKLGADMATGGAITITEQNVKKLGDYQEFKNKIDYANKTEYEAYILRVGKALREKGLSVDETNKIMSDMHNENLTSYKSALSNLHKQGKSISVKPPHLTARTWSSFYDNADEGLGLRTYHVFKAIGDGIRAMPGKAKKFLSETNDDLYEIFGGIKRDKDGKLNINKGIFEKGVATELYNQKVESAKNLLDIAKNEYRAYEVNKEIEEQKERKDKFALQKDLRESLIKQGYSPDEANAIAKKAAQNGDWEAYREARNRVHNLIKVKEQAKKNGVYSEDMQEYIACACYNSECSMMWRSYKGNGVCTCEGPLFGHEIPISTNEKVLYGCINQITKRHYEDDLKIFNEMRASDAKIAKKRELNKEKKYQKLLKIIQAKNAKAVEKDLQKVKQLMQKDETLTKAAELFAQIKEFLYPRDRKVLGEKLTKKLVNYSNPNLVKGNVQKSIATLELAQKIAPKVTSDGYYEKNIFKKNISNLKKWQKTWESMKKNVFPTIYEDLRKGRLQTVKTKMFQVNLSSIGGVPWTPQGHACTQAPEYLSLKEAVAQKNLEYATVASKVETDAKKMMNEREPQSAIDLLTDFLNSWEQNAYTQAHYEKLLSQAKGLLKHAQDSENAGDKHSKKADYASALKEYRSSLSTRNSASVERKLDNLYKRHDIAMKYKAAADKTIKDGHFTKKELLKAIGQYEQSVKYWPDKNLQNLINRLKQKLEQQKRKAELEAKIAKLEREKARQEEEAMTSAGLDFGNRFGARESRRTEQVQEKQNRDVYAGNSERADDQEEMLKRLKQNLEKIKATIPTHVAKPVKSAWIPPKTSYPSSGSDTISSTVTTQPSATATPTQTSQLGQDSKSKLSGTFKGIWYSTDKGEKISGTVSIQLTGTKTIHVQYFGDDEDKFDAPIGSNGNINIKADDGETVFSGKITRSSNGQLQGSGRWNMMNRHGIWKNKSLDTPAKSTGISTTGWDGLYTGTYTDKHLNTRDERCQNHSGKLSIIVKGNRFSGDGSGTITKKGSRGNGFLHGSFNNGYKADGAYIVNESLIMGFISGPPYCSTALDLRKDRSGKKTYTPTRAQSSGGPYYIVKESSNYFQRTAKCSSVTYAIVDAGTIDSYITQRKNENKQTLRLVRYPLYTKISVTKSKPYSRKPALPREINKCTPCPYGEHIGLDKDKRRCHKEASW